MIEIYNRIIKLEGTFQQKNIQAAVLLEQITRKICKANGHQRAMSDYPWCQDTKVFAGSLSYWALYLPRSGSKGEVTLPVSQMGCGSRLHSCSCAED